MKILVTGGAGFIGSYLIKNLIDKKHKILSVDNLCAIGAIPYIHPKSKFIKGDISDKKVLKNIKKWKPEVIYHLAAQSGGETAYDDPKKDYLINGFGTYQICKLAKELKVKRFIYTSTTAVYGSNSKREINEKEQIKPDSLYGISKFAGEMFVNQIFKKTKTKSIIFRLFNTYGPGENLNFLKKGMVSIYLSYVWKNRPILIKGSLDRIRDLNYVEDVVYILSEAININIKKTETVNLSSGKSYTVKKIIEEIILASKKKNIKIIKAKRTPGDSKTFHTSNKKLIKLFPEIKFTSFREGLNKYFQWINQLPVKKNLNNHHPFEKLQNKALK
ncbi:NAD(P)-dependent oxidoreductase [Candidatus Pelagibacter sp.]|nr:NAD(P)-dependent oxidoreductase [Candidatus Pelagibacter sp.]MDC0452298.1 NAD(P)-dependent oxidoreductase [Candidatus Pelagibacter sp.]